MILCDHKLALFHSCHVFCDAVMVLVCDVARRGQAVILARKNMEEEKRHEAIIFKHELMEVRFGVDSKRCNYKRKKKLLVQRKIEG